MMYIIHLTVISHLIPEVEMSGEKQNEEKRQTLRQQGTLNPRPQAVTHELFQKSDFFDPNDLVQVKYEMLRQVQSESRPISQAAKAFGLSRPSFYQAQAALTQVGLAGLLPHKSGPKEGHKLTAKVMEFLLTARAKEPSLNTEQLAEMVAQNFQLRVHPRSIERQLRREKKRR
jgi:transposase